MKFDLAGKNRKKMFDKNSSHAFTFNGKDVGKITNIRQVFQLQTVIEFKLFDKLSIYRFEITKIAGPMTDAVGEGSAKDYFTDWSQI